MTERLLRRDDIAALFLTTRDRAASILAKRGCYPIDFGRGPGGGPRWLASAVEAVIREMFLEAQPKPPKQKRPKVHPSRSNMRIEKMTANELHQAVLTSDAPLQ